MDHAIIPSVKHGKMIYVAVMTIGVRKKTLYKGCVSAVYKNYA